MAEALLELPSDVLHKYEAWTREPVSTYPGRSVMLRLSSPAGEVHYLKVVRRGWFPSAEAEAARTIWARSFLPVPRVLGHGATQGSTWLVTAGIDASDATATVFRKNVAELVDRLAEALRRFHEAPVKACPFQFRVEDALEHVQQRRASGLIDAARDFHPEFASLTVDSAVQELEDTAPEVEDLVVCHGDYCVPNVLLRGDDVVGYVDLGELGVADRWWDLAVATWSLTWNFGPGFEDRFLQTYGIEKDIGRMQFYRLLYDLVS